MRIATVLTVLVVLSACSEERFDGEAGDVAFRARVTPLARAWSPDMGVAHPTEVEVCVASTVQDGGPLRVEPDDVRLGPASADGNCSRIRIDTTDVRVAWSGTIRNYRLLGEGAFERASDGFTFRPVTVDSVAILDPASHPVLTATDPDRELEARLPAEVGLVPGVMWSGWFVPLDATGRPVGYELARATSNPLWPGLLLPLLRPSRRRPTRLRKGL